MTQEELAKHRSVSFDTIETLEDGEDDPDLETLQLLAGTLGLQFAVTVNLESQNEVCTLQLRRP